MNVTRTSLISGATNTIFIEGLTQEMLEMHERGALIQDAMPCIPQELREFIMTGITPEEWNKCLGDAEGIEDDSVPALDDQDPAKPDKYMDQNGWGVWGR